MGWDYDEEEALQGNGVYINAKDVVGHLLLVWSIKYMEKGSAPTKFNPDADCIVVDVVDLDQRDDAGMPGLLGQAQWWYQSKLIGDLRPRVGKQSPVLAYMNTEPSAKGNPAYVLLPAHALEECRARADEWRSRNRTFTPGSPVAVKWEVDTTTPAPAAPAAPQQSAVMQQLQQMQQSQRAQIERLKASQTAHHGQEQPPF